MTKAELIAKRDATSETIPRPRLKVTVRDTRDKVLTPQKDYWQPAIWEAGEPESLGAAKAMHGSRGVFEHGR